MNNAERLARRRTEKTRRNERRQRRKAKARRRSQRRRDRAEPELSPWPDTTGLSEEEAAMAWEEFFFWEDYFDRNPDSTFAAPR